MRQIERKWRRFIGEHLDKGHSLETLREILTNKHGYRTSLIDAVIKDYLEVEKRKNIARFAMALLLIAGMLFVVSSPDLMGPGGITGRLIGGGANTYYVDPVNGLDSNTGLSTGTAFKTLSKLTSVLGSGDIGYLRGGKYYISSQVNFNNKNLANGVSIAAYPGEKPIISGVITDYITVPNSKWTSLGSGVWSSSYASSTSSTGWVAGYYDTNVSLYIFKSYSIMSNPTTPEGIYFDNTNDIIYLKLNDTVRNPNNMRIAISDRTLMSIDEITGAGFEINGLAFEWAPKQIRLYDSNNIYLVGNRFNGGLQPIDFRTSSNVTIQGNEVFMKRPFWGWEDMKSNVMETTALWLQENYDGLVIRDNHIYGHFNGILLYSQSTGKFRDVKVINNTIHDIGDDAIEIEDYANGALIANNTIYDAFVAISVSPANSDQRQSKIIGNLLIADKNNLWNSTTLSYVTGECFKVQSSSRFSNFNVTGNTFNCYGIYGSGYSNNQFNNHWTNNIFYSQDGYLVSKSGLASNGIYFNNNLYYRNDGGYIFRYWNSDSDSRIFRYLSSALASTLSPGNWDTASQQANPQFTSISSRDYTPLDGSPACTMSSTGSYVGAFPCVQSTPADTSPPGISSVSAAAGTTTANVTWSTGESANSSVSYGSSSSLGSRVGSSGFVSSRTIGLSGLVSNRTYYYNVTSCDVSSNCNTSGPRTFTTQAVVVADTLPPGISSVSASTGITTTNITWSTSESANSSVNYGTSSSLGTKSGSSSLSTSRIISLGGLNANTTYYYNVTSCDSSGNCNSSGLHSFITQAGSSGDVTAPTISLVFSFEGVTSANISWTTSELADSSVNYGTTSAMGNNVASSSLIFSRSITLTGLVPSTTYYYNVTSCDSSGNCRTSGPRSFTTDAAASDTTPPVISSVSATAGTTTADITWSTGESANSSVSYGSSSSLGSRVGSSGFVSSRTIGLSGLVSNRTYYYNVTSCDVSGNCNTSGPRTFTTQAVQVQPPAPNVSVNQSWSGWNSSQTTNFSRYNSTQLSNLSNVTLANNYGEIRFTQPLNISESVDLTGNVVISRNSIYLDSDNLESFDEPALLTFDEPGNFNVPLIMRDGSVCYEPNCSDLTFDPSTGDYTVYVSGFSTYSIAEGQCSNGVQDFDETGMDCGGIMCSSCSSGSSGGGGSGGGGGGGGSGSGGSSGAGLSRPSNASSTNSGSVTNQTTSVPSQPEAVDAVEDASQQVLSGSDEVLPSEEGLSEAQVQSPSSVVINSNANKIVWPMYLVAGLIIAATAIAFVSRTSVNGINMLETLKDSSLRFIKSHKINMKLSSSQKTHPKNTGGQESKQGGDIEKKPISIGSKVFSDKLPSQVNDPAGVESRERLDQYFMSDSDFNSIVSSNEKKNL